MAEPQRINYDSPAAWTHLEIIQGVIQRMAENSRSCKVWCVTLVAAILVLVARTGSANHALIALVPTAALLILDAYYLALERAFRDSYTAFVGKLHAGDLRPPDLYTVAPSGSIPRGLVWALFKSFSVWPFYIAVVVTTLLAWQVIL